MPISATHEDISSLKTTINHIKYDIKQFEEKGILVDIQSLIINKDLIQIEEWKSNEIEISTLPTPFRTKDCSNMSSPTMASNNRYLLMYQYSNLCLFDKELTIVKEYPWNNGYIPDMCWSSILNSFIIITNKDGVLLVNEDMTLVEPIKTIEKENWLSCACSNTSLFVTTNKWGSDIFQFNLLSSFNLVKQWNSSESCEQNEVIHNIAYNNDALALMIMHESNLTMKIELRSSITLDRLWSLLLDFIYTDGWVNRPRRAKD